jgi:acetyl-CoA carboxylase carboxyltransferase component
MGGRMRCHGSRFWALRALLRHAGEKRWKITDVVGSEDGLGVECLSGSGAIASIYAKAFKEGFTITLVSGRTVGIGAYLARLGRRSVQNLNDNGQSCTIRQKAVQFGMRGSYPAAFSGAVIPWF